MPDTFSTANSQMKLTTPLGTDVLLITGLSVREGISQPFHIQVNAVATNKQDVAFDKLLGKPATVELALGTDASKSRFFHGIVTRELARVAATKRSPRIGWNWRRKPRCSRTAGRAASSSM